LRDYIVQLRRYGYMETVMKEVPAADGLTTAYLFQGNTEHFSSFISTLCIVGSSCYDVLFWLLGIDDDDSRVLNVLLNCLSVKLM